MPIIISPCEDAEALARVQRASMKLAYQGLFPDDSPFPGQAEVVEQWRDAWRRPGAQALMARVDGVPAGTVEIEDDPEFGEGLISRLYVAPEYWSRGVGGALLAEAVDRLRARGYTAVGLWVLHNNERARQWYLRRGWTPVPGVSKDPWGTRELRYRLPLAD